MMSHVLQCTQFEKLICNWRRGACPFRSIDPVATARGQLLHRFMSGFLMISIEDAPRAPARDVLQTGIQHSQPAAVTKTCVKVSVATQFRRNPTLSHTALEVLQSLR